ncbi:MAG: HAD family phosphatase [Lachnospiraceae bacterium]|nr:HAD family phosphatase [Lachnospiraceae bacterium]
MINTVIFDMGNVLIDFRWEALFHEMGLAGEKFDRMAAATVLDPVWREFDRGVWTDEMILDGFIKNAPELESELREFMDVRFPGLLRKFDYTDEWMDALRAAGYKIYILSNFSEKADRECADELDYIKKADGAVLSYKIRMIKPDEEIYRYLLDTYGIDPKEAVFIDDTAENIEGAKKLGITAIRFTDKESVDAELAKLGVKY